MGNNTKVCKEVPEKKLEEMTFDELAELATHRIHSALLEGGGREMKRTVHLWMGQAIIWRRGQEGGA